MKTNKPKHTPGPWDHRYCHIVCGKQSIARVTDFGDGEESEANLDLILAAPDLLEALNYASESIDIALRNLYDSDSAENPDTGEKYQDVEYLENAYERINKALAKAKGEVES